MATGAFHDPRRFGFVPALEAAHEEILVELDGLRTTDFSTSPDSLTEVSDGYDETGWLAFDLHGDEAPEAHRARCPATARASALVPGMVNASLSLLRPGTHLYPHRGEIQGVLRCHLALRVPAGDLGLRVGGETRTWRPGRCLVFDDTALHEAWNHTGSDRVVLLVTFETPPGRG